MNGKHENVLLILFMGIRFLQMVQPSFFIFLGVCIFIIKTNRYGKRSFSSIKVAVIFWGKKELLKKIAGPFLYKPKRRLTKNMF